MTKVSILHIPTEKGNLSYHAVAGERQSHGRTAGEALDALTTKLSEDESGTLIIVQSLRPDRFFNAARQQRLAELMELWRTARDKGEPLPVDEQAELDLLNEVELCASADRAAALSDELRQ